MIDALTMLQSIAGFAQDSDPGAARPTKLATIDPAYNPTTYPTTLPKVTFEGEAVLSGRTYPVVSEYWPTPGDRVIMTPIGNGYVITGSVSNPSPGLRIRSITSVRALAGRSCNVAAQDIPGTQVVLTPRRAGGIWAALWQADFQYNGAGATTGLVQLTANTVQVGPQAIFNPSNVITGARVTAFAATAGVIAGTGAVTLQLQALRGSGVDNAITANTAHTALLVLHVE